MNARFRNYVTDVAFRLSLGKTDITALQAVKEGKWARAHEMGLWVPAINRLAQKGLVDVLPIYRDPVNQEGFIRENADQPFHKRYKLTEEGKLVWRLLELSGLVERELPTTRRKVA